MQIKTNTSQYIVTFNFYIRFFLSFILISNIVLWLQNYSYFYQMIKIGGDFGTAILSVYDIGDTYDLVTFGLILISIMLSSISIALFLEYIAMQRVVNKGQVGLIGTALFLTTIMAQCMSCTTAILGTLVSTAFVAYLPFGGLEISFVAILILLYNIKSLIYKINNPYVC